MLSLISFLLIFSFMAEPTNELYIKVLTIAAKEELPSHIGDSKIAPHHIFAELLNAGYLLGRHEKLPGGGGYFANLKITMSGRQLLQKLSASIVASENRSISSKTLDLIASSVMPKWYSKPSGIIALGIISGLMVAALWYFYVEH